MIASPKIVKKVKKNRRRVHSKVIKSETLFLFHFPPCCCEQLGLW